MSAHTIDSLQLVRQLWSDAQEEMHRKPRHSLQNSRIAAERICKNICIEYANEHPEDVKWQIDFEDAGLGKMTGMLYKAKIIPRIISTNLCTIQHFGNMGAHDIGSESAHLQTQYIESCLSALTSVRAEAESGGLEPNDEVLWEAARECARPAGEKPDRLATARRDSLLKPFS